ncbi:MAG: hypothetical protein BroJett026_30910 [Betaproteobacteria bacterium]|nr:MAG: hypothetical protein BroJett026_30910 [Betaproteobacteria bacterium]
MGSERRSALRARVVNQQFTGSARTARPRVHGSCATRRNVAHSIRTVPHSLSSRSIFARPSRGRTSPLQLRPALACALFALHPAGAAAAPVDGVPGHTTWALLAALGLVAVAIAALTVTRPRDERRDEAGGDADAPRVAPQPPPADFAQADAQDHSARAPAPDSRPVETADFALALPAAIRTRRTPAARRAIADPPLAPAEMPDVRRTAPAGIPSPDVAEDLAPRPAAGADAAADAARDVPVPTPPAPPAPSPFLALHHVDLSIEVLRGHLAAEPRPMPAVWVMLLDLCRTHGREQAFREIAAEFHARFNVRTPSWEQYPPDRSEPGLEAYPRIVRELTLSWGTHECRRLLDRLLYDTRNGERRGFTINAYNDLIALRRAADAVLDTIEQDLAEESRVREAFAQAAMDAANDDTAHGPPARSPLVGDLEQVLDDDLRDGAGKSALEHEHPALAEALVREWGNAALAGRLHEMLARGRDGHAPLSAESRDDVELLRSMAERLADARRVLAAD